MTLTHGERLALLEKQVDDLTRRTADQERFCAGLLCMMASNQGVPPPASVVQAVKLGTPLRARFVSNALGEVALLFEALANN